MVAQDSRHGFSIDCGASENNVKNGVANPFLFMQAFASRSCIRFDVVDDECKLPVENEAQASLAQLAEHALRKRTVVGLDRKSTRLNSSHSQQSRMPSSA